MSDQNDELRFRSFAERYVVERAGTFRVGGVDELEDAWNAVDRAKKIYNHIREKSLRVLPDAANADADTAGGPADDEGDVMAGHNANTRAVIAPVTATVKRPQPWAIDPTSTRKGRRGP